MNTVRVCVGALTHSPMYAEVDRHHIYPSFLCYLLGVPKRTETVDLCSGCHDIVHHILRHRINTGALGGHHTSAGIRAQVDAAWGWWVETSQ